MNFSERLKELRAEKGITAKELAKVLGITKNAIYGYENYGREPKYELLIKIAEFFNIPTDYLLGLTDVKIERKDKLIFPEEIQEYLKDLENLKWIEMIIAAKSEGMKPEVLKEIIEIIRKAAKNREQQGK